jgi:Mg2+-importing ATPase
MGLNALRAFLTGASHLQRTLHHFRRPALAGSFVRRMPDAAALGPQARLLQQAASADLDQLLQELGSGYAGISQEQAGRIREKFGLNDVDYGHSPHWSVVLWHCYFNPFNTLLSVLALVSWFTADRASGAMIALMVVLSTSLRFWQEGKSNRAADALKAMVSTTAAVVRPQDPASADVQAVSNDAGHRPGVARGAHELPIKWLVPGDLVLLAAGDMIPADCRVVSSRDLFVSQSALTGEAMPAEKFTASPDSAVANVLDLPNILFLGTDVVSGSATAVVLATGRRTYFGALSRSVMAAGREATSFQRGMSRISWLLLRFTAIMTLLVFLANGVTKGDWPLALLFSLSVAVGLTPEMLPMIVTSTLAKGAVFLSRKKVIVKRLDAIQGFGAMDVLCTDKTGTLTQDKIVLAHHVDAWGDECAQVLEMAYLNSYYQTGLKNLLDVAVLEHAEIRRQLDPARRFAMVDEIPFDFNRRRMSVIVSDRQDQHLMITKGAVEQVLTACTQVFHGQDSVALDATTLEKITSVAQAFNMQGLRVVAVAVKQLTQAQAVYGTADECDLTLLGYIVFLDPPKDSTAPALKALADDGVAVKVLTGDNELVTQTVCRHVGLPVQGILLGSDLDQMTDDALGGAAQNCTIFARLTPAHKERIVRLLRARGHVVGYMGDGLNDAAALRAADVGISVDTGVDIAKEAADIVLLEKSLMVLEQGVLEGRRTFANMLKYIRMASSSNFGNVFSVLLASVFLPFLPMLPLHLLVQNLLYDISQIAIPFDNVDRDMLQRPPRWNPEDIGRFMLFFGPISSLFDLLVFAVLWFVYGANSVQEQGIFQSGWFVAGLLTQTLVVHLIRTPGVPFVDSRASFSLTLTTLVVIVVAVFLPMGPLAPYFRLQPLPVSYFAFLGGIVLLYATLVQVMKGYYGRRYGSSTWC